MRERISWIAGSPKTKERPEIPRQGALEEISELDPDRLVEAKAAARLLDLSCVISGETRM